MDKRQNLVDALTKVVLGEWQQYVLSSISSSLALRRKSWNTSSLQMPILVRVCPGLEAFSGRQDDLHFGLVGKVG